MIQFGTLISDSKNTEKNLPSEVKEHVHVLILGSGPAGFTAAIYAARANMKPILYQGLQAGGQLTTTTEVDNFPGYPDGVTGPEMMEQLQRQAERFGTEVRWGMATSVDFSGPNSVTMVIRCTNECFQRIQRLCAKLSCVPSTCFWQKLFESGLL